MKTTLLSMIPLRLAGGALAALLCAGATGCSSSTSQPFQPAPPPAHDAAPTPVLVLRVAEPPAPQGITIGSLGGTLQPLLPPDLWEPLTTQVVDPLLDTVVSAGRCVLDVPAGALDAPATFTVSQHDSTLLDFELGPHGATFSQPVTLCVSYAGTNADPSSPNYDGSAPKLFWYDEAEGEWREVSGVNDAANRKYTVKLDHFSRYAVEGKAGW